MEGVGMGRARVAWTRSVAAARRHRRGRACSGRGCERRLTKSGLDGFFEWMEGDAIENRSQGHAFSASFTGVGEKTCSVCCMGSIRFIRNPSHTYVFPFPETVFYLGYQKFIMWTHSARFVRERFRTGLFKF